METMLSYVWNGSRTGSLPKIESKQMAIDEGMYMTLQQTDWIKEHRLFCYVTLAVGIVVLYVATHMIGIVTLQEKTDWRFMLVARLVMAGLVFWFIEIWLNEKNQDLCYRKLLLVIFTAGIVIRITYMLYTFCTVRSHDMGDYVYGTGGKAGYILYAVRGELPPDNGGELYQQPFYFMLAGIVSNFVNKILGSLDNPYALVDAAKIVSCYAACMILLLVERVVSLLHIGKKGKLAAVALIAFTPAFYQAGGRVGENALATYFMILIVELTLLWYQDSRYKYVVGLAFAYGLGMMTKVSCSMLCPFTAWMLLRKMKGIEGKKVLYQYILQIMLFFILSIPMGLWYCVRNYLLFKQPFSYVYPQAVEGPYYRGDISFVRRFFSLDIVNLWNSPYVDLIHDSNLPAYLLKSELFGEFQLNVPYFLPVILLFLNVILTLFICFWGIQICIKRKKYEVLFLVCLFGLFAMYAYYGYPFSCSMNFRYFLMIAVGKALLLGHIWDEFERNGKDFSVIPWIFGKLQILFAIFSIVLYLVL